MRFLDIIPDKLWWICFVCFALGMVMADLSEINMFIGGILAFAFGAIIAFYTLNKKIVRNK